MRKILMLLCLIPVVGSLIVINRVEPYIFGMPMILAWMVFWLVMTSIIMFVVYKLDPDKEEGDDAL
ncbi:DUF3311 domain-containing protein [Neobacillus kokaensis]|uniref:Membrane protein YhjC n=1 Tax=Neobacillus kokaensis TaxID=2759023 RepID=A0ABQ3N6W9_9BACI|nr:DUF3311 domain-containing protein [Neobacillus kokaensis]GHH99600.1 putative membrane protein YhjC [Neobacillus kokaensis]